MTAITYPLIKTRLSNERLMSALLLVLLLYNLPVFIENPGSILPLLLLTAIGLVLDAAAHFLIYKRPVCAVSAGVTALIIFTLSQGAPLLAQGAALAAALVIGKAVWGGMGKNLLNPAMVGLTLLALFTPLNAPAFQPSPYLLPGVLLSLPFLYIRPYAGLGMIFGMTSALVMHQSLTPGALLTQGVFFWGCLVVTDPVTTTSKQVAGFVIGLLTGFLPLLLSREPIALPLGILCSNLLSFIADRLNIGRSEKLKKVFTRRQRITPDHDSIPFVDLTGDAAAERLDDMPPSGEILRRIEENAVFGMGGAAFPAIKKIRTVIAAEAKDKHFIVNATECDPGLIHDKWLLKNRRDEIARGIEILQKCIPFSSVTVAAKDFSGVSFPAPVKAHKVTDFYPAGAEKILAESVLKTPAPDLFPAACGILVLNVQTVLAVYEAVLMGRKADTRFLTAADLDRGTGKVVRVKLGSSVLETAENLFGRVNIIYTGGGIMNARLSDDEARIDEKTNFLAIGQIKAFKESVCSQCDICSAYCPASLQVRDIAHSVDAGKIDKALRLRPEKCMECGLCSAVCLAGRDQAKRIRAAKYHVNA